MPFKSDAQRRYFHWAESRGKLPKGTSAKWQAHTQSKDLPERVNKEADMIKRSTISEVAELEGLRKLANKSGVDSDMTLSRIRANIDRLARRSNWYRKMTSDEFDKVFYKGWNKSNPKKPWQEDFLPSDYMKSMQAEKQKFEDAERHAGRKKPGPGAGAATKARAKDHAQARVRAKARAKQGPKSRPWPGGAKAGPDPRGAAGGAGRAYRPPPPGMGSEFNRVWDDVFNGPWARAQSKTYSSIGRDAQAEARRKAQAAWSSFKRNRKPWSPINMSSFHFDSVRRQASRTARRQVGGALAALGLGVTGLGLGGYGLYRKTQQADKYERKKAASWNEDAEKRFTRREMEDAVDPYTNIGLTGGMMTGMGLGTMLGRGAGIPLGLVGTGLGAWLGHATGKAVEGDDVRRKIRTARRLAEKTDKTDARLTREIRRIYRQLEPV